MNTKKSGFTLIELLVVIAIIGILSSVVLASLNSAREKSRDARRVSDVKQLQLALELYFDGVGNNAYPTQAVVGAVPAALAPAYISIIPLDPQGGAYQYISADGSTYCLGIELEGDSAALDSSNPTCETSLGLDGVQGYAVAP